MSLAVVNEHQAISRSGRHLFRQPMFEEDQVTGIIRSCLCYPGLGFGICDWFPKSSQIFSIPFHINTKAEDTGMMTVLLHQEINQHGHLTTRWLHLEPDFDSACIKGVESWFE